MCTLYSVTEVNSSLPLQSTHLGLSNIPYTESSSSNRTRRELTSIVRRLITSGRLFSHGLKNIVDSFFAQYGAVLTGQSNRLFSAFLFFLDHTLSASSGGGGGGIGTGVGSTLRTAVRVVGLEMCASAFLCRAITPAQRRELVTRLTRHVIGTFSGSTRGRGAASALTRSLSRGTLTVLLRLARLHPKELLEFDATLHGILESIFHFASAGQSLGETDPGSLMCHVRYMVAIIATVGFG